MWLGYLAAFALYLLLYLPGVRSAGNDSPVTPPPAGPLTDFVYLSVFRTFILGVFGGPWDWQPTSYAWPSSTRRAFDWIMWILAAIVLCGSLLVRRRVGRFWLALAVYLLGSLATIAAGRVAWGRHRGPRDTLSGRCHRAPGSPSERASCRSATRPARGPRPAASCWPPCRAGPASSLPSPWPRWSPASPSTPWATTRGSAP